MQDVRDVVQSRFVGGTHRPPLPATRSRKRRGKGTEQQENAGGKSPRCPLAMKQIEKEEELTTSEGYVTAS